jgi:hypothetical protein
MLGTAFRRFDLVTAVVVESGTGRVILCDHGDIGTSDNYA